MSCHDIGRGMNSVVKLVSRLYDEGKMDTDTARQIIAKCREGVHWCDGNEDEATACIRRYRCGKCLKIVPQGEYLFLVWAVSQNVPDRYRILSEGSVSFATDGFCQKCFDEVVNEHCKDDTAGARERAYIMAIEDKENYISEGYDVDERL